MWAPTQQLYSRVAESLLCELPKITSGNVQVAGWQDGRMAGWQDGRMAGWQDGRMAGMIKLLRVGIAGFCWYRYS